MTSSQIRLGIAFATGIVLIPILVLLGALLGLLPADAISEPPGWESAIGRHALSMSLASRAHGLVNPVKPNDEVALLAGMTLYRNDCAGCHGDARRRSRWGATDFYPRVPQFGSENVKLTPEEAYVAIRDGVRYSGMGAWGNQLAERDLWLAANFVSRMHSLPPKADKAWRGH